MNEKKKEVKKPLTQEELLARQKARAKEREEDRVRAEAIEKALPKMSFRQVRGALKAQAKRPSDGSPLTSAIASIMLIVLDNTKSKENPFARLQAYPR